MSDLEASVQFSETGLELPIRERADDPLVPFFELAGTWLALYPRELLAEDTTNSPDGSGFEGGTLAHNVESKTSVDAALDEAVASGAEPVKPARDTDWGGYAGYFSDPDDHL
ncbi:VOC family protein [Haladaptatus halobius]|uniref:VOC family protein n=1 Tax=Haladaptatus halobius TaxID=2884875 RepID=UPI0034A22F08